MSIKENSLGLTYVSSVKIKRTPKLFKFFGYIFFVAVILVGSYFFVFYVPIADLFNLNKNMLFKNTTVYALVMSSFADATEAQVLASEIKEQGGAGYVLKQDNTYYVLASGYENIDDANKVKQRLLTVSQIETQILNLNYNSFVLKHDLSHEQLQCIKNAVNLFFEQYKFLYELSIEFDSAQITKQEAVTRINNSVENCQNIKNNYDLIFKSVDDYSVVCVKIYLNNIISVLRSIESSQNFSSQIKYAYFQMLQGYTELLNNVS